jgi:hypothetical protein
VPPYERHTVSEAEGTRHPILSAPLTGGAPPLKYYMSRQRASVAAYVGSGNMPVGPVPHSAVAGFDGQVSRAGWGSSRAGPRHGNLSEELGALLTGQHCISIYTST